MSQMSSLRRKLSAHKDMRVASARRKVAIRIEQNKPDYQTASKDERRGRIASIINRIPLFRRRAA